MKDISEDMPPEVPEVSKNKDIDTSIIQEYEDLFHTVQGQLKQCQSDQDALRSRMESVIFENESLADQLKTEISKNSVDGNNLKSINNNMRQQLDAAIQERNSALEMWQTSLKLVSALEKELQDYRDNSHLTSAVEKVNEVRSEYSRAITLLEDKVSAATSRLAKDKAARETAEEKLIRIENDYKLLSERYEKRCKDVDEALISKEMALKKVEELEKDLVNAMSEAKEAKLGSSELETALEQSIARLEEVLTREVEAREKVDEALQIVDVALIERDNALKQATQASEEVQQLRATIAELISEAGIEVRAEAEQIKEQYNSRIKTVLLDMRRLQAENKNKTSQVQKLKSDLATLEVELQRTRRELDTALRDRPSLSALDRKLDGIFRTQEIAGGESIRADLEIEQLKAEIVKLTQNYELEQRQYLLERHVLEEQVNGLQTELENSSKIISDYIAKNDALNSALYQKEQDLIALKKAYLSNSTLPPEMGHCEVRSPQSQQPFMMDIKMYQELQRQLDNQRELTNKWKDEANLITTRFQTRLRELNSEASSLRRQNRDICNQLHAAQCQLQNYQQLACGRVPGRS
ncbi:Sodium channel and clathrin linker 1 [Frankliniella fusca]|uniref:Sodium channel and clathrin linker 1 n=1 Tax=Frankliniella fusca TaxID=407009 RepID=A0AAE1LN61_9NEOP|nr:Sodium channel and clathrin linker 1 [Frankliniella fusca]